MTNLMEDLIAYDTTPPDEGYSPLEFGERVGRELPAELARQLVVQCWASLPGSLAESFLEGFFETANIANLPSVLLDCLSSTREVSSVCSIVGFLRTECEMTSVEIIRYSADKLSGAMDGETQNRLAYTIQSVGGCLGSEAERIAELLASGRLTDYARSCLEEACRLSEKSKVSGTD